jgi:hypothetical protein
MDIILCQRNAHLWSIFVTKSKATKNFTNASKKYKKIFKSGDEDFLRLLMKLAETRMERFLRLRIQGNKNAFVVNYMRERVT